MSETQRVALELAGLDGTAEPRGWTARLDLEFARRGDATYLARRAHVGPLLVQRPFFPEPGVCHVYVVHPPGGIVGGDDLTIAVRANDGAHALLTTPAATKFYRCADARAQQRQQLIVQSGTLEWLPQETIFYRDAQARSETIVELSADSRFIGWEIPCLGLPARGEPFERGQIRLGMEVWIDGVPRFIDRLQIDGEHRARTAAWGLAGFEAIGTLLAYPATNEMLSIARELTFDDVETAATLVDDVLVYRCFGAQAEPVKRAFAAMWSALRPLLLARPAMPPRIWAT